MEGPVGVKPVNKLFIKVLVQNFTPEATKKERFRVIVNPVIDPGIVGLVRKKTKVTGRKIRVGPTENPVVRTFIDCFHDEKVG